MTKTEYKNIIKSIITIFVYFFWSYLANWIISFFNFSGNSKQWIQAFIFLLLLIGVTFFYHQELKKALSTIKDKSSKKTSSLKIFFVGYGIYFLISLIIKLIFPNIYYSNIGNNFISIPILSFFFIIIYYPIVEEIVFKVTFKEFLTNKWFFVIVTGFLNAFFQVTLSANQPIDLLMIIPDTIFYITLSYIYFKTDNILIAIFYRMVANILPAIASLISITTIFTKIWR
jgi:membrane protease YdiL (CAAX protease family)